MRRINAIYIWFLLVFVRVLLSEFEGIPESFLSIFTLVNLIGFFLIFYSNAFGDQPFGYALWIDPPLKMAALLIQIDGKKGTLELEQVKKYVSRELDDFTAEITYKYFKKQLGKKLDLNELCNEIKNKTSTQQRLRILQGLVKIALVDRLLSENEILFIRKVSRKIGIHINTLNSILDMYTYVTQEDIDKANTFKPTINYSVNKAYSVLGLDNGATLQEIKEGYRQMAKLYHPDKQRGTQKNKKLATAQFQIVLDAYNLLKEVKN